VTDAKPLLVQFNKLKNWGRDATHYDKTKEFCLGFVALASIKLLMPFVHEAQYMAEAYNYTAIETL